MNKKPLSLSTQINLLLVLFLLFGLLEHHGYSKILSSSWGHFIVSLSLYGLSGSLTNSLAITMIFEKIPFLWGSGLIEKNFTVFQKKLKETLMEHLFSQGLKLDALDIELVADKLYAQLQKSQLAMVTRFITPTALAELLRDMGLTSLISESLPPEMLEDFLEQQIKKLSPADVKNLILKIMDEHLEWLILWGAAFGVIIGFCSFMLVGLEIA